MSLPRPVPQTVTVTLTPLGQPKGSHPGIRAYRGPDGQMFLALDGDAADKLAWLLDDVGPGYDLGVNPGAYGLSDSDGAALDQVRWSVAAPLRTPHPDRPRP